MKKKYYVGLFLVIAATLGIFVLGYNSVLNKDSDALKLAKMNVELKDFKTEKLDETEYTLANVPKGIVVAEVFASWCIPCQTSFPNFVKFQKANTDVSISVLAIAYDDVPYDIHQFMKKYGTIDTVVMTNVATKDAFELRSVPQTLFIKDHKIIYKVYGSMDVKEISQVVELAKDTQ